MGLGIIGARRLMDQFEIESDPGNGTTVWLKKLLPKRAAAARGRADLAAIAEIPGREPPAGRLRRNSSIRTRNCSARSKKSAPARRS